MLQGMCRRIVILFINNGRRRGLCGTIRQVLHNFHTVVHILCFLGDFPPQFIVAGVRFSRVFAPGLSYYRGVRSPCRGEKLCQRREVRRYWGLAGSCICRQRGSGPIPCSRASILIPAACRSWPGASGQYGVLQPLTVRKAGGAYELVAGERRLRAARLAGLTEVPCLLADVDEEASGMLALVENLQRRDLDYHRGGRGPAKASCSSTI